MPGEDVLQKQYVFVIGAPRSGTTWLQTLVGAHPDVANTVELTLFHRYLGPWVDAWEEEKKSIESEKWFLGQPMIWSEEEFEQFMLHFLRNSYDKVLEKNPAATHILDKHPGYTFRVDLIKKLLPNARFIHLIRDGRNVASSLVQIREKLGENYGTAQFDQAALQWTQFVQEAQKATKYGADYLEVRYDQLTSNTSETLQNIFSFCGLEASEPFLDSLNEQFSYESMQKNRISQDASVKITGAHFNREAKKLSVYDQYIFHRVAGDCLIRNGYEQSATWWSSSAVQKLWIPIYHKLRILKRKL